MAKVVFGWMRSKKLAKGTTAVAPKSSSAFGPLVAGLGGVSLLPGVSASQK